MVSRLEIGTDPAKLVAVEGCRMENLKISDGVVSFDRWDEALPMPVDPRAVAALKLAPVLEELSRYELRIDGLPAREYEVKIDGEVVGKASREALAKGWMLGNDAGAITRQSQEVLELVFKKNDVFFRRWREVQLFTLPSWAQNPASDARRTTELANLDRQIAELEAQLNEARQPVSHHFELRPVSP